MQTICLHEKEPIEAFFRRSVFLHLYSLGDLDPYFWRHTTWYGLVDGHDIRAIALLYSGLSQPTLLALGDQNEIPLYRELLRTITPLLPRAFYFHLAIGLSQLFDGRYELASRGRHHKMGLADATRLAPADLPGTCRFNERDADELLAFYRSQYPEHAFEPSMLDMGHYYGIRGADGIISAAGVHVYSERYGMAALGNIATHRKHRRKGYAKAAVSKLCRELRKTVEHVGLNVKADNEPAVRCYHALGFEIFGAYEEGLASIS